MLAVVNQPRTQNISKASFRLEGDIPEFVILFLKSAFPNALKIEEESTPFEETEWFKNFRKTMTSGEAVKADRTLRGWTQKFLAEKLGISVQNLSELERDVRPVSKKMAVKIASVFGSLPEAYFKF